MPIGRHSDCQQRWTQFLIVRDFIHRVTRSWRGRIYSLRRGTLGISRCSCMAKSPAASLASPLRATTCRLTGFALDAGCPQLSFPCLASAASFWIEWAGNRECHRQRPCQFGIADRALRTRDHISTCSFSCARSLSVSPWMIWYGVFLAQLSAVLCVRQD